MPFTPDEVEHKTFLTTLRGYDKLEVATFLRAVADDLRRVEGTGGRPPESPALLRELRVALEDALAARAAAVADAEAVRSTGEQQAVRVLDEARAQAAALLDDARRRAAELLTAAERVGVPPGR